MNTEFVIEVLDKGLCDVRRKGRAFAYECDDLDEALRMIRRKVGKGVVVTVIERDGYQVRRHT